MAISNWIQKLAPPGNLPEAILEWTGPASYTVVTTGAPPSGGDTFPASLLGVNQMLLVIGSASYSGHFQVVPVRVSPSLWTLEWRSLVTATVGGQAQTTGTEAAATTNLSAETVRLEVTTLSA